MASVNFKKGLVTAQESMDNMLLKQLGAEIISFYGLQCFIKFNIHGHKVSYAYNLNSKNQYYLQRIKPYPMPAGVFENAEDVVKMIKLDVEQFRIIASSSKFEKLLDADQQISEAARNFEDLFLYYDVEDEVINDILNEISTLKQKILEAAKEDHRRFFKKEPETL